jgi:hypothetical protein
LDKDLLDCVVGAVAAQEAQTQALELRPEAAVTDLQRRHIAVAQSGYD